MTQTFGHVIAAIATPFRADLEVDFRRLIAHAKWLFANGCDGLVLFGTTGEAASLTAEERKRVLEELIEAGIPPARIMVGTGCCAIADTAALTKHAYEANCAGALILPPFFFKGLSDDGIAHYYDCVIANCGVALPPLYLYHIPQTAGAGVSPDLVERLIERHGAKIRGYKDSSGNWNNTSEMLSRFPMLDIYVGSETFLTEILRAGGKGCISASVNVQPLAVRRAFDGAKTGEAGSVQAKATAVRKSLENAGPLISAVKAVVGAIHRDDGWTQTRPPLTSLPAAARTELVGDLRQLGLEGM